MRLNSDFDDLSVSPHRITLALRRRQMSKKFLADQIGVTPSAVTQWITEGRKPTPHAIELLSEITGFPTEFFFEDTFTTLPGATLRFRARRDLTARLRDVAVSSSSLVAQQITPAFHRRFTLPTTDLPDLSDVTPILAAELLRRHWRIGYGPIGNLTHLLESKGIRIFWLAELSSSLDAFCFWQDKEPFVFLNTFKDSGERARFDLAHELGHLVLHRMREDVDQNADREADQFASAFLLPEASFAAEIPSIPTITRFLPLKSRWKVSVAAMVRRTRDLNKMSEWQYKDAVVTMSTKGWRTNEPNASGREQSQLHEKIFGLFLYQGITPLMFSTNILLPYEDLIEFCPVAKRFQDAYGFDNARYSLNDLTGESPTTVSF